MHRYLPVALALLATATVAAAQPTGRRVEQERMERAWQVKRADAAAVRRDIEVLQRQLVQLASIQSAGERSTDDKRARLAMLNARETELSGRLGRNRNTLARLLGALQLYRRDPPPALLVHPGSARDAVRAAILIKAMAPELQRRGRALAGEADAIQKIRRDVAAASEDLFASDSEVADRRARIERLINQKNQQERSLLAEASAAEQTLSAMARGSASVAQLMARLPLEAQIDLQSAPSAGLVAPVEGRLVRRFGQMDSGAASQGWTWRATSGALVRAPSNGLVEYVGPLKGYDVILILRVGGGYHLVLTGLEAAQAVAGRSVTAGEPIGRMAQAGTATGSGTGGRSLPLDLYLELRKDGAPVDPAPWLSPAVSPARAGGAAG